MKLASYIADGKECFGVVTGDGVITMNDRFGGHAASLKEAIAGGLLPTDQGSRGERPAPTASSRRSSSCR